MHNKRLEILQQGSKTNKPYVIYWMQGAQRTRHNHALNEAISYANLHHKTLIVVFNIVKSYPEATLRAYQFMLDGLLDVYQSLHKKGISFHVLVGDSTTNLLSYESQLDALFLDKAYLKTPRYWRKELLSKLSKDVYVCEVDTNVLIPVSYVSNKVEYGAYTIRPKIHKLKDDFLDLRTDPLYEGEFLPHQLHVTLDNPSEFLHSLPIDPSIRASKYFVGGQVEAFNRLKQFIQSKLPFYMDRNEPYQKITSTLSPYIHFGQISTQSIVLELLEGVKLGTVSEESYDAFFEQVIVRRELAHNYVYYLEGYDQFESMTEPWAYQTMDEHAKDVKPHIYDMDSLIACETHDPYWNAAMKEMIITGYMHNYMRMYWAKKIIEWSKTYQEAYLTTLKLNNMYFIDGRDPVSYASVAWNYGKHDRAWNERPIFGKLRYMNLSGLERKFNMKAYVSYVDSL